MPYNCIIRVILYVTHRKVLKNCNKLNINQVRLSSLTIRPKKHSQASSIRLSRKRARITEIAPIKLQLFILWINKVSLLDYYNRKFIHKKAVFNEWQIKAGTVSRRPSKPKAIKGLAKVCAICSNKKKN